MRRTHDEMEARSAADAEGRWQFGDAGSETGLIRRCRENWSTPIGKLTNEMLATFIRQRVALRIMLPEAQKRLAAGFSDDTELYEGQLREAVACASAT